MANTVEFKIKVTDLNTKAVTNLAGEFDNVNEALQMIQRNVKDAAAGIDKAASQAFKWGQVRDAISGVMDTLQNAVSPAAEFEQAMRGANTMALKGETDYKRLKDSVKGLSSEIPIARDLLANGLYQTISNGVPEDNWIEFLNKSARSATGGLANLEKVVTVTSTVIKNYGLSWDAAGSIQDKIQMTAKNGVTSFEQMADALPRVSGSAATLGVSIDELMATFATLTGVSGNTAEVSTQLAAIFTALIKPSSEAATMAKEMGIEFNAMSVKAAGGLVPFLQQLNTKINEHAASTGKLSQEIYASLFGSSESLRALIPLTGELAGKFEENTQAMADSAGSIDEAFNQVNSTGQAFEQRMKNSAASLTDFAQGAVTTATPIVLFAANTGIAVTQVKALYAVVRSFSFTQFITSTKLATLAQTGFNSTVNLGKAAILSYAMSVNLARNSIASTTGATKLMNIAIAASPYVIAAVGAAALGVAIYKIATRSSEAEKAQKRLNEAMDGMQKEVTTERLKLDALFTPLLNAKEGTDEWKRARDRIQETYSDYLQQLGIEEIKVDNARKAYELLSGAILNTARARASEKALTTAGDTLADKESKKLTEMRSLFTEKYGEETGERIFNGIANSIRKGEKEIPEHWKKFIKKFDDVEYTQRGEEYIRSNPVTLLVNGIKNARNDYEKEYERIVAVFGKPIPEPKIPELPTGGKSSKEDDNLKKKSLTLDDIKTQIELLQKKQQTASDAEGRNIQSQINQLKRLKKEKELAMGIGLDPDIMKGSIDAMKRELSKFEKELSNKPVGEASIDLQVKIDKLKKQIEGAKIWIEKEAFKDVYGEIKVNVVPSANAGRTLGQMAEDFQDEENRKHPKQKPEILTHDYIKKMKLPKFDMPKLEPKKSGFEQWNDAVDKAYQKNQDLVEGMSGIGSVMGSLGQAVGGAAGEWLNWGANVVQAVAAAIPQITALLGLQTTQVAANTAVAGSGAAASTASIPVVGPILAIAAVASVLAALASLPKFANGGLAYGPTMGLFGEYSGAQNNPEVIAPLNKLRQLIQPSGGMGGIVEFKIDGRMLRGVLNKVDRYNQRTR